MKAPTPTSVTPRVGISSCLLGEAVRHDGGDKRDPFLVEQVGPAVEWVPVCPELEIGLPVPRPPIHLLKHGDDIHLVDAKGGADHTNAMLALADARVAAFQDAGLDGFVFKARSPSCGIGDATLTNEQGYESGMRSGLFADRVRRSWPELPVISDAMLFVPEQREAFLARVFAGARLAAVVDAETLSAFHGAHRALLASRLREPDDTLEEAATVGDLDGYAAAFRAAMRPTPSRRGHVRALRALLPEPADGALQAGVDAYADGHVSLGDAVRVVRDALGASSAGDVYLHPHTLCFEMYFEL